MYYKLILQVLGGLVLFIFGKTTLSDSLQKIISNSIKSIISILQKNHGPGVVFSDIVLHFERIGDLLYDVSRNLREIDDT